MARVDRNKLDYIMGIEYLRAELLGLHLVRERIASTDIRITANGDQVFNLYQLNITISFVVFQLSKKVYPL